MCGSGEDSGSVSRRGADGAGLVTLDQESDLLALARHLGTLPEKRSAHLGSIGYGETKEGDRVLLAVDRHYDPDIVAAVATALRERGARVDVLTLEADPGRRFELLDEVEVTMRRAPWRERPRRWEGVPWIENLAKQEGYDLLIHGKGGPVAPTSFRYEQMPWLIRDHFSPEVVLFPSELIAAVSQRTWDPIWQHGQGGRVRITDREGTDLTYTLHETYWDGTHHGWVAEPKRWYGHLFSHPTPPLPFADAEGVVHGTTSHFSRAFPRISLALEGGQVTRVEGGAAYGDSGGTCWRRLAARTTRPFRAPVSSTCGKRPSALTPKYVVRAPSSTGAPAGSSGSAVDRASSTWASGPSGAGRRRTGPGSAGCCTGIYTSTCSSPRSS